MRGNPVVGEVVKGYLENYSKYPSQTLAKIIHKQNPELGTIGSIRSAIMYYRGNLGDRHRERLQDTKFMSNASDRMKYMQIPAEIPKTDREEYTPYFLADGKWLVMSDAHVPYHEPEMIEIAVRHGKRNKVTGVMLLGDWVDCFFLSKFAKDPRKREFAKELDAMNGMLNYFEKQLKCRMVFKLGNHEARWEMYMYTQARELLNVADYTFNCHLYAPERGMDIVREEQIIDAGHLTMLHGHEYRGFTSSPVNPARSMLIKAKACTLSGHEHRTSQNSTQTIKGTNISNWSLGMLCEAHPKYRPLNDWNYGFAIVDKQGMDFDVSNLRVINREVV